MERLATCLHNVLDPEIDPPPPADAPKPYIPLNLKCSILHDVASGLTYLHGHSPPIIHRDLSARNILLNSGMVAKIADLGMARTFALKGTAALMTKAPGATVYMPPEALESSRGEPRQKAMYNSSIDIFSFGVLSIFTLSQTFPCDLLSPKYQKDSKLITRTELERRDEYMQIIYRQFPKTHPLILMIERCLDFPEKRPSIHAIRDMLEEVKKEDKDKSVSMNPLELYRALEAPQTKKVNKIVLNPLCA